MPDSIRPIALPLLLCAIIAFVAACNNANSCASDDDCFSNEVCYQSSCVPDNGGQNNGGDTGGSDDIGTGGDTDNGTDAGGDGGTSGPTVVEVEGGGLSTCARFASGEVKCWGRNASGELGNGETEGQESTPVSVQNMTNATGLESGHSNNCAFVGGSEVYCWGSNGSEQITPDDNVGKIATPTSMGVSTARDIAVSDRAVCVLLEGGGGVTCVGDELDPVVYDLPNFSETVRSIEGGFHHACAVLESRDVLCWGSGNKGEVGGPGTVDDLPSIEKLAVGAQHSCALSTSGSVYCWGSNADGQLGVGGNQIQDGTVQVQGLSSIVDIAAGFSHTCSLDADGAVLCWGKDGANFSERTPSGIFGLDTGVEKITAGSYHACALIEDGDVFCWGRNAEGQLGDGSQESPTRPVQVAF